MLLWIAGADGALLWASGADAEQAHARLLAPGEAQRVELRTGVTVLARVVVAPGVGQVGVAFPLDGLPVVPDGTRSLTRRQLQVLQLLAGGQDTAQIAEGLGISTETARNHVRSLLARLGAHSRLEAVILGIRRGLV